MSKKQDIPLEDKPIDDEDWEFSLEEEGEEPKESEENVSEPTKDDKKDKPKEEKEEKAKPTRATHYKCGGELQMFARDMEGRWWMCSRCRSEFFFRSPKTLGVIGNPKEAEVIWKRHNLPPVDRSKRTRFRVTKN